MINIFIIKMYNNIFIKFKKIKRKKEKKVILQHGIQRLSLTRTSCRVESLPTYTFFSHAQTRLIVEGVCLPIPTLHSIYLKVAFDLPFCIWSQRERNLCKDGNGGGRRWRVGGCERDEAGVHSHMDRCRGMLPHCLHLPRRRAPPPPPRKGPSFSSLRRILSPFGNALHC